MNKTPHKHAQWLHAIGNGESLQALDYNGKWCDALAYTILYYMSSDSLELTLRIKPKTITIGKYEVPEPMRVKPAMGSYYYTFYHSEPNNVGETAWSHSASDLNRFNKGLCWNSKEDAEIAATAIISLFYGGAK